MKSATSGDIDADGDPDIWAESSGGANHDSRFIVNNGDGSCTSDLARAPATLLHNPDPEYWRHLKNGKLSMLLRTEKSKPSPGCEHARFEGTLVRTERPSGTFGSNHPCALSQ